MATGPAIRKNEKGHYEVPFDCKEFMDDLGPVNEDFSNMDDAVRRFARRRASSIFADWQKLQGIVERWGPTIQKRPDLVVWRLARGPFAASDKKMKSIENFWPFLCPAINLEDLAKPEPLMLMLSARGRNFPDVFIPTDTAFARAALPVGIHPLAALTLGCRPKQRMLFRGRKSAGDYGEICDESSLSHFMSITSFTLDVGLMVLAVQSKLYPFLVQCCKEILHDVSEDEMLTRAPVAATSEQLLGENEADASTLESLLIQSSLAPYRVPGHLDLSRMEAVVAARLAEAEDHLWSLREDPGYFSETLYDWSEHCQESLVICTREEDLWDKFMHNVTCTDESHTWHTATKPTDGDAEFWAPIVQNVLTDALEYIENWRILLSRISRAAKAMQSHASELRYDRPAPEAITLSLLQCNIAGYASLKFVLRKLRTGVPTSPPMRNRFNHPPSQLSPPSKSEKELMWIFTTMFDEKNRKFEMKALTDELELLMRRDGSVKKLISPWVARELADLSAMVEFFEQIKLFQPWSDGIDIVSKMGVYNDRVMQDYKDDSMFTITLYKFENFHKWPRFGQLANPSRRAFHYPLNKRYSRKNVQAMQEAEARLDAFWRPMISALNSVRLPCEDPDCGCSGWKVFSPRHKAVLVEEELPMPFSGLNVGQTSDTLSKNDFKVHVERQKVKTRGKAAARAPAQQEEQTRGPGEGATSAPPEKTILQVDQRALKIFNTLFFVPTASSQQPGETPWVDFLHAMNATGFTAEKWYGSAWHFQPTKLDVERGIQMHEPHPSSKIPFAVARRMGRRLHRAYGWHGGMFTPDQ
ncbi:Uu.00g105060.m01.CDS01 [Anthostomella pinea]|uniref:Uu.00g105060.m01.CDS01 n=1 Tax=Anthostomella pinea TaxID=933095 RepID=A0AAI8VEW2_9PEZI|nr:Uu.00g105060.m01.CDS01 [Anthostomella pinea]